MFTRAYHHERAGHPAPAAWSIGGLAGLILAIGLGGAAAQEMQAPRVTAIHADWNAAAAARTDADGAKASPETTAQIAHAAAELFPDIAASPVPVLIPFDTTAYLRDRAAGKTALRAADYLSDFHPPGFFLAGPGGYDVVFTAYARDIPALGVNFPHRIDIHLSGSALLYEVGEPAGLIEWPVNGLDADFPGVRRVFLENHVRYLFTRFGVPYVVSIQCFDGGARYRKISCRDADKVATRFLKALHVAGGTPPRESEPRSAQTIDRPAAQSGVFTYRAPGDIIPGTGVKGHGGRTDRTVYARLRFPLADAPAFANSQSFNSYGNCDSTGRAAAGTRHGSPAYRCRVGGSIHVYDEADAENYSYPWQDDFCEHRYFYVGQCPGGLGHQGQDIRPASCKRKAPGANRCEPYMHEVVAVRGGMVMRAFGQMAAYVVVNAPGERWRARYLHMLPRQLDLDGVLSGRRVHEGEVIGKVGNFERRERATTYHLHFDLQVPTKYGWVFVNPYMTLVAAYERLIRGRGTEIRDTPPLAGAATVQPPGPALP